MYRLPTCSTLLHLCSPTIPAKEIRSSAPFFTWDSLPTISETGGGFATLSSSASLTASSARRASSRRKPALPSLGQGVPGALVELTSGGVSAASTGSRKRSSQWHSPTLVLSKSTCFTFGVVGVRMRGRELSTGKNRPPSPPLAPPGHCVHPPV